MNVSAVSPPLSLLALASAAHFARPGSVGTREERWFRRLNTSAGPAEPVIWGVMQLGNGLASAVAPLYLRARGASWSNAARVGFAGLGGWQLAKVVKAVIPRERPARLLDDVALRDGDPGGRGFVSGHSTVAMSIAVASAPVLAAASSDPRTLVTRARATGAATLAPGDDAVLRGDCPERRGRSRLRHRTQGATWQRTS